MSELNCERVCMAAMALADGYQPKISRNEIEAHLVVCPACREEVSRLQELASLLQSQHRARPVENIWPGIEGRLPETPYRHRKSSWYPFVLLGVLLVGYKLVELIPDRDFGLLFKFAPIVFVVAAFGYLKQNPFTINPDLKLKGE